MSKCDDVGYEVGYCKPPKAFQFSKGQSANPKGRGKQAKQGYPQEALSGILRRQMEELIPTTINGQVKSITLKEALAQSMLSKALKGSTEATKILLGVIKFDEQKIENQSDIPSDAEMAKLSPVEIAQAYKRIMGTAK